ncbi:MAG: hypothetical protein IPF87_14045 [Gemmatimonadetes bacterium]|nr:hypothetical protein [Gemmatimonadota bacterium]
MDVPWYHRRQRQRWSPHDLETLRTLAAGNTPTRVIGLKLGRSEQAGHRMASRQGVSLKPVNQAPYGRHD